jgi:hypothetical protein
MSHYITRIDEYSFYKEDESLVVRDETDDSYELRDEWPDGWGVEDDNIVEKVHEEYYYIVKTN